jgi:hypothetical protein
MTKIGPFLVGLIGTKNALPQRARRVPRGPEAPGWQSPAARSSHGHWPLPLRESWKLAGSLTATAPDKNLGHARLERDLIPQFCSVQTPSSLCSAIIQNQFARAAPWSCGGTRCLFLAVMLSDVIGRGEPAARPLALHHARCRRPCFAAGHLWRCSGCRAQSPPKHFWLSGTCAGCRCARSAHSECPLHPTPSRVDRFTLPLPEFRFEQAARSCCRFCENRVLLFLALLLFSEPCSAPACRPCFSPCL